MALKTLMSEHGLRIKQPLTNGKLMLCGTQDNRLIKVGTTDLGRALALADFKGWERLSPIVKEQFNTGAMRLLCNNDQLVAIELQPLPGQPLRALIPPHKLITPHLKERQDVIPLSELLTAEGLPDHHCETLLNRHGDVSVTVTPSHGDYIYWNVLKAGGSQFGLIDYEYSSPQRCIGFDDLHFRFAPWWLRGLRHSVPYPVLKRAALRAAKRLRQDLQLTMPALLYADLFFVHWGNIRRQLLTTCPDDAISITYYEQQLRHAERGLGRS